MGSLETTYISTVSGMMENNIEIQEKKCTKYSRKYSEEYSDYKGIQRLRYFGKGGSLFEKICWFGAFVTSLLVCSVIVYQTYRKWQHSPIMVNFSSDERDINEIPFPSVTICREVRITKNYFNYSHVLKKLISKQEVSPLQLKRLQYMSLLCAGDKIFSKKIPNITTIDGEIYTFLSEGNTKFIDSCSWMGMKYDCKRIFHPIVTDEGLCYTFNMLELKDILNNQSHIHEYSYKPDTTTFTNEWTVDFGYSPKAGIHTYPRRALLPGSTNSLTVNMYINESDVDYACTDFQGFQIVLHQAIQYPLVKNHYFRVPMKKAVIVAISPMQMLNSDDVKEYSPKKRECYLQGEKKLHFFKNYTQRNCQFECLTNKTRAVCGCVAFYMPRKGYTPICGNGNFMCMKDVRNNLDWRNLQFSIDNNGGLYDECECLPMCSMMDYETEITEIDYDKFKEYEALGMIANQKQNQKVWSQLVIYFKKVYFIPRVRSELYGYLEFLANVGGLLGLFIGFSLLSLFEIIYFLSVRLVCYGYKQLPAKNICEK